MNKILALLLLAMMPLCCAQTAFSAAAKSRPATESAWQLAAEAYVYALPLVLTDATRRMSTNTDGTKAGRAPVNQFNHATKLADASFRTVVTPNVDTVYSQAWLNILPEPVIYVMPKADRFFRMQVLDAWTNTAAVLDRADAPAAAQVADNELQVGPAHPLLRPLGQIFDRRAVEAVAADVVFAETSMGME